MPEFGSIVFAQLRYLVQNINKKNHLFKEVIVEDEAEDLRGS